MNSIAVPPPALQDRSWSAKLELQLEHSRASTRLSRSRHSGPLYVQKPFYPEGRELAHVYLLHPPGGIVSGDHLEIQVDIKADAAALVTTPGAARIYRAREQQPLQRQQVKLNVGANASLEWFPLETIVFDGACVELSTTIDITEGSHFIGWELCCFGLPASGALFKQGRFQQHYLLRKDGVPLFVDRMVVDVDHDAILQSSAGMQGNTVSGFFLLGPIADNDEALLAQLRKVLAEQGAETVAAISKVGDCYIGRYLGHSAEQGRKLFTAWWHLLRPQLLGLKACEPRIWAT